MITRLRLALLLALTAVAGCELCDAMPPDLAEACMAGLPAVLNCDTDGDGSGDASGTCDANQICWVDGSQPGACV